jgi:trehalose synthase
MLRSLDDYRQTVGEKVISGIRKAARPLRGKHILHINSTYLGGGVAEILSSLVPLMNDVGIDAGWRTLHANPDFFTITKKFHNALQGRPVRLSEMKKRIYTQVNEVFSRYTHIDHDFMVIHDPQPLPLVSYYRRQQPWVWRCHLDLTDPHGEMWEYLRSFVRQYDAVVISNERFRRQDIAVRQHVILPAIDPLSPKNRPIPKSTMDKMLRNFRIPTDKPLVTQISRFDVWKDQPGLIRIFRQVRKQVDCRLVLCGSAAADDPESTRIYEQTRREAADLIESGDLLLVVAENHILVNTLQRVSEVIVQKSLREGFGLTVCEALWKQTPVVASNVGGIPLQVEDGVSGFLVDPDGRRTAAGRIVELLRDRDLRRRMGEAGRETVREKFLVTRLLSDYLELLSSLAR